MFTGNAKFPIFICGEFIDETAKNLINNKEIILPEGAILLHEREKCTDSRGSDLFKSDVYIKRLYTLEFGKHLLWSPCLPSTHTLLSQ